MLLVPIQHVKQAHWAAPLDAVPAGTYRFAHDDYIDRFGTLNKYGWFEKEYKNVKKSTTRVSHPLFPIADRTQLFGSMRSTMSSPGPSSPSSPHAQSAIGLDLPPGKHVDASSGGAGYPTGNGGRSPTPSALPAGRENEQTWAWCLSASPQAQAMKKNKSTPAMGSEMPSISLLMNAAARPGSSPGTPGSRSRSGRGSQSGRCMTPTDSGRRKQPLSVL